MSQNDDFDESIELDEFDEQYEEFLVECIDNGVVWAIQTPDEGMAVVESNEFDDALVMPFWSNEKSARKHLSDEWSDHTVVPVELDDFIDNWLPGMQKDDVLVGVNWNDDLEGVESEPLDLAQDLLETD